MIKASAHAGSRTRVTSMGGLYDTATLHALMQLIGTKITFLAQRLWPCFGTPVVSVWVAGPRVQRNARCDEGRSIFTKSSLRPTLKQTASAERRGRATIEGKGGLRGGQVGLECQ